MTLGLIPRNSLFREPQLTQKPQYVVATKSRSPDIGGAALYESAAKARVPTGWVWIRSTRSVARTVRYRAIGVSGCYRGSAGAHLWIERWCQEAVVALDLLFQFRSHIEF